MSSYEVAADQIEARKTAFIEEQLTNYDQQTGITGPPSIRPELLPPNFAGRYLRMQQAGLLFDTYLHLKNLSVTLEDVIRLEADLDFRGTWETKSRVVLDALLRIERRKITVESKNYPNTPSINRFYLRELADYFLNPPENNSLPEYSSEHGLKEVIDVAIQTYKNDFLIPQVMWMPDIPSRYDRTKPAQVLDIISQQINSGAYPTNPPHEVHENRNLFGEDSLHLQDIGTIMHNGQVIAQLTDWGLIIDANGLLNEVTSEDVPFNILDEGMSRFGSYLTEIANGRERSPRDCYHAANFGIFALLRGRIGDGDPINYFLTAHKAYGLARTLADVYLQGEEHESFIQSLQTKEAECSLRIGLAQLYDKTIANETEEFLQKALTDLNDSLVRNPDDRRLQRLKIWTLYHLGVFYQDVMYDSTKAQEYIEKTLESIPSFEAVSEDEISEKAVQRLVKERGIFTIKTNEGNKEIQTKEHIKALSQLEASIQKAVSGHYGQIGLQYITVPEIVGVTGSCENVDTLFKVMSRAGVQLFITQTGQLALEQALQVHRHGVYTIIHSGRDEEMEDNRHLRQFRLTEEEFGSTMVDGMTRDNYDEGKMFEALLQHIEASTKTMIRVAVEQHGDTLSMLYGRDLKQLRETIENPYYRITYEDALILLRENGFSNLKWGDDLKAEHEQAVIKLLNNKKQEESGEKVVKSNLPVFIMRYPKEIKFFNMKVSEIDPRVVLSADLILPIAGEATGASVREHRCKQLEDRLLSSEMFRIYCERTKLPPETAIDDFRWYLDIIYKEKTDPHAGYGIGNERVMQFILGLDDIRSCSGMRLLAEETGDWERKEALPLPVIV